MHNRTALRVPPKGDAAGKFWFSLCLIVFGNAFVGSAGGLKEGWNPLRQNPVILLKLTAGDKFGYVATPEVLEVSEQTLKRAAPLQACGR